MKKRNLRDWLKFLKENFGTTNSDVADSSGISKNRIRSIVIGRTALKPDDLRKLTIAYPILRERAQKLGINPNPIVREDVKHLTEEQAGELSAALIDEIRQSIAKKGERILNLENENGRLHGIINNLQSTIDKLLDK